MSSRTPTSPVFRANTIFTQVHESKTVTDGRSHCFRHINWGYGGELTSVDDYLPQYVHEARVLVQAIRKFAIETFVKDDATKEQLLTPVADRSSAAPRYTRSLYTSFTCPPRH